MPRVLIGLLLTMLGSSAMAADSLTIRAWLDIFIESCVGGGSSFSASGSLDAGAGFSLKKVSADGSVAGQVKVSKSEYKLLSEGISNAMTAVAASQADKVRECLAPLRQTLLDAMTKDVGGPSAIAKPLYILSPHEERVMRFLAVQRGEDGKLGKNVSKAALLAGVEMSDLRFSAVNRQLQEKLLASELSLGKFVDSGKGPELRHIEVVSLWPAGEDYVLKMGYAK